MPPKVNFIPFFSISVWYSFKIYNLAMSKRIWNYILLSRHTKYLLFCELFPECNLAFLWNTTIELHHCECILIRVCLFFLSFFFLCLSRALGCHYLVRVGGDSWTNLCLTGARTDNVFFLVVTQYMCHFTVGNIFVP